MRIKEQRQRSLALRGFLKTPLRSLACRTRGRDQGGAPACSLSLLVSWKSGRGVGMSASRKRGRGHAIAVKLQRMVVHNGGRMGQESAFRVGGEDTGPTHAI